MQIALSCLAVILAASPLAAPAAGQEAQWIWSPAHDKEQVPQTSCHFRKTIYVTAPDRGQVTIVADDQYELYVNGRRVGNGGSIDRLVEHDISRHLMRGRNIIGIKVTNARGSTAALAARVAIQSENGRWQSYATDRSWRTNLTPLPFWNTSLYNDQRWDAAQEFGQLGRTAPWDVRENVPEDEIAGTARFKVDQEFEVEQLLNHEQCGSLIAMAFNEFGHLLASRDGGPLMLFYDSDDDGRFDKMREYCNRVESCQGILALNGEVFVTAQGPDGNALYRLADEDQDGKLESVEPLIKFAGTSGEHGAHGVVLGPDGMIYVVAGNQALPQIEADAASPYRDFYEGDLVQRYEDPVGHSVGVKAPGGVVLRTDVQGARVELIAGGLRNPYDLAFTRRGELLVHDSDTESDIGTAWYRPTRLYHVTAGAEFGWRSGWAKWPENFIDALPGILDTGRGSPTGAVVYNHHAFPVRYQHRLFLADWSEGRILAVTLKPNGASLAATSEVFLEGQPLNVTDLEVGPDGAMYFVTGGRGTSGGVYRVRWKGDVPAAISELGEGISAAIRQPQLTSAYGRQQVAAVRKSLGEGWNGQLSGVARSKANPWYYRTRALTVMQLFGPPPAARLLINLAQDESEIVRAHAAQAMGVVADEQTHDQLIALLDDPDRLVRRHACESLLRAGQTAPWQALAPLLKSDDRHEAWAARRLLERLPVDQWRDRVLASDDHRLFIQGGLALLVAHGNHDHALAVLERFVTIMDGFVTDRNFVDMLRLVQVALERGEVTADEIPDLCRKLSDEFPASDEQMNRELARLLAYLQIDEPLPRYLAYLNSAASDADKLHLALHLRFISDGWPEGKKLELIEFYQRARQREGGDSYRQYLANVERDFAKSLSLDESRQVLARGREWPDAALGALYALPTELDDEWTQSLKRLDKQLADDDDDASRNLRTGIIAVLARSGSQAAMDYLRSVYNDEPERRLAAAIGLAQQPQENWDYLVRSLSILTGDVARDVLVKLAGVNAAPQEPEYYRQVILRGLELKDDGAQQAVELLRHWTGEQLVGDDVAWQDALTAWQQWYADKHPDRPPAELPVARADGKWKFDELIHHLTSDHGAAGSRERGASVFEKAQCAKCHRYGDRGENLGPDLTSVSKRFMKKEVLESILFPAHVIPDQYTAKTVLTTSGRTYTGILAAAGQGRRVVLQADGDKVFVAENDIDEIAPSKQSAMPDGLLDDLTLEQISDLFAYLGVLPAQSVARRPDENEDR